MSTMRDQMQGDANVKDEDLSGGSFDDAKTKRTTSDWRVELIAPTKPEHKFEPRCAIVAHSVEYDRDVRLADIPDPDEGQLADAQMMATAQKMFDALKGIVSLCNKDGRLEAAGNSDQMRAVFAAIEQAQAPVVAR